MNSTRGWRMTCKNSIAKKKKSCPWFLLHCVDDVYRLPHSFDIMWAWSYGKEIQVRLVGLMHLTFAHSTQKYTETPSLITHTRTETHDLSPLPPPLSLLLWCPQSDSSLVSSTECHLLCCSSWVAISLEHPSFVTKSRPILSSPSTGTFPCNHRRCSICPFIQGLKQPFQDEADVHLNLFRSGLLHLVLVMRLPLHCSNEA